VTGVTRVTKSKVTGTQDLKISHWNAEGIRIKKTDLHSFLRQNNIDVCYVQETYLTDNIRFTVRGYEKGGILTLVKNTIPSAVVQDSGSQDTEFLGVKLVLNDRENGTVFNVYSPPDRPILLDSVVPTDSSWILAGDLNSHSPSWGYDDINKVKKSLLRQQTRVAAISTYQKEVSPRMSGCSIQLS
jgi:hypothetical protein